MYEYTLSAAAQPYLEPYINDIYAELDIDWYATSWEDLRMSLYSALAAQLYITYNGRSEVIPRDIDEQGDYWVTYYHPGGDPQQYIDDSERLELGCKGKGVDLAFILDSSGSIGPHDFSLMLDFVRDTIIGFDISDEETRISVAQFSTYSKIEFYFDTYSSESEVLAAIDQISYTGGSTNTPDALLVLRTEMFTEEHGSRPASKGLFKSFTFFSYILDIILYPIYKITIYKVILD